MDDGPTINKANDTAAASPAPLAPQDPSLPEMLESFFQQSIELKLVNAHFKIVSSIREQSKPGLTSLYQELGIDAGAFSRWVNGSTHADERPDEHYNTTLKLLALFIEQPSRYITRVKSRQKDVRKIRDDLIGHWTSEWPEFVQKLVERLHVHLTYLVQCKERTAAEKLRSLAQQIIPGLAEHMMLDQNFVRHLTPKTVPARLRPIYAAFGRDDIVARLADQFDAPNSNNRVVTIIGPPLSGKSSVVQALVSEIAKRAEKGDRSPSLLFVDLAGAETPQRAVYLALKSSADPRPVQFNAAHFDLDATDEDNLDRPASEWNDAIALIRSMLPPPDPLSGRVVIFDGYPQIEMTEDRALPIKSLIEQTSIKSSFVLIESLGSEFAPRAMAHLSVHLLPLLEEDALEFLTGSCQVPANLANPAIEILGGLADELFYPGPLHIGSGRFHKDFLEFRMAPASAEELSMSILDAAKGIVESVVLSVLGNDEDLANRALQSLMAMSVIGTTSTSDEILALSGLHPIPREALQRIGWFSDEKDSRLIGFALHGLRASAAHQLVDMKGSSRELSRLLEEDVKRLITTISSDQPGSIGLVIEEAATWLDRIAPQDNKLLIHLRAILFLYSGQDDVKPLSDAKEEATAASLMEGDGDLSHRIAALVIASRRTADTAQVAQSRFVDALNLLLEAINTDVGIDAIQLNAVDGALLYGALRFHTLREILAVRHSILALVESAEAMIFQGDQVVKAGTVFLEAAVSFKINSAHCLASQNEVSEAMKIATQVATTFDLIPVAERTSFTHWKLARLAMLQSRLNQEIGGRCLDLERACVHALECVRAAPQDMRTSSFLLRTVQRYLDVEANAKLRDVMIASLIAVFEEAHGQAENWAGHLRGRLASLLRRTVRLAHGIEAQREIARAAMRILLPSSESRVEDLDHLGLLAKARLHAILGETKSAREICRDLIRVQPSVEAWMLNLRMEDNSTDDFDDLSVSVRLDLVERATISDTLRSAMKSAEDWIKTLTQMDLQSPRVARLLLWIKARRWQAAGSIERAVRDKVEQEGRQYDRLGLDEKLACLDKEYRSREGALNGIGRQCKMSTGLVFARARNLGQYVRTIAVLSGREPDVDSVIGVYDRGLREIPGSMEILFHKAEYQRYIWRTDEAISNFRAVLSRAERADLRQAAALSLAKVLHITAVEFTQLDGGERLDRLVEAQKLVRIVSDTPDKVPEILLLKEHIAFELGESVDWVELDKVCEKVAGGVDSYLASAIKNSDILRLRDEDVPQTIADALRDNFTSREVLGSVAQLYFRRGMKGEGNDMSLYFAHAVGLYSAVAMLERSWLRTELPATRFNLARTISVAADRLGSPNPIQGLWIGGADNQLRFAGSKLHSAVRASAGEFRGLTKSWQGIVSRQWQTMGA